MPNRPCPVCNHDTPRRLEASTEDASVNYYRCDYCGHVWTADKNDSGRISHVTEFKEARDDEA